MTALDPPALASANALHHRPYVFYLATLGSAGFAVQIMSVAVGWQVMILRAIRGPWLGDGAIYAACSVLVRAYCRQLLDDYNSLCLLIEVLCIWMVDFHDFASGRAAIFVILGFRHERAS